MTIVVGGTSAKRKLEAGKEEASDSTQQLYKTHPIPQTLNAAKTSKKPRSAPSSASKESSKGNPLKKGAASGPSSSHTLKSHETVSEFRRNEKFAGMVQELVVSEGRDDDGGDAANYKPGDLAEELKLMMFGFGDAWEPLDESVKLMEEVTVDYIRRMTVKLLEVAQIRGRLDNDCFTFLVRKPKDQKKSKRILELNRAYATVEEVCKNGFDVENEDVFR